MEELNESEIRTANKVLEYLYKHRHKDATAEGIVNDLKRSGVGKAIQYLRDKNLIRVARTENKKEFFAITKQPDGGYFQTLEQYESWLIADQEEKQRIAEKENESHKARTQSAKSMIEIAASLNTIGAELKTEVSELKGAIDDLKKSNEGGSNHAKWNNRLAGIGIILTLGLGVVVLLYGQGILNRPAENQGKHEDDSTRTDKKKPDPHFSFKSDSLQKDSADSSHKE